jgi:hypothetical protein
MLDRTAQSRGGPLEVWSDSIFPRFLDWVARDNEELKELRARALAPTQGRVLELGLRNGIELAPLPTFSVAVDPNPGMAAIAHRRMQKLHMTVEHHQVSAGGARRVRIGDLKLRRMERFTYEYDFGDSWVHDIRIEATLPIDPGYPVCVAGTCAAPPEDCGGPDTFMENRWRYEAMEAVNRVRHLLIAPGRNWSRRPRRQDD